jgi:carboxymethylenebutenolidase
MLNLATPEGPPTAGLPTRRSLAAAAGLFAGFAPGGGPLNAAAITTSSDGLVTASVTIPSGSFELPGYLARPAGRGRRPAIIVVSEVFGLHAYIQDVCRRLARAGYVALAPAFFARAGDPAPLTDWNAIRAIVNTATDAQVMSDVDAANAWLDRQPYAARSRGITGFCWGGAVTWMAAARSGRFAAGVAWYGRLRARPDQGGEVRDWPLDVAPRLKAPVLGLYADNDTGIPLADVEAMRAVLPPSSQIMVYPNTQHGFHADYRPMFAPAAAHDGEVRMLSWFGRHGLTVG